MTSDVTGIGGLFFRSRDPEVRAAWYREHLGISAGHTGIWQQDAGMTVFARIDDPEGLAIELWQPPTESA